MNLLRVLTARPWIAIPCVAAVMTVLTFGTVHVLFPADGYVRPLFFDRSWIQYATTICFWVTLATLGHRHAMYLRERRAYHAAEEILESREFAGTLIWSSADLVRSRFMEEKYEAYHDSLVFRRILNALDRLRKTQSTSAIDEYFRTRSELDAEELETGYTSVRYLVWLIPTLGFIGTVTGIGAGIAGFGEIIQNAQEFDQVKTHLPGVTRLLGTAFDTTLLALAYSVIVMFYQSHTLRAEERMLEELDTLCLDGVCALFEEHTSSGDEIVGAVNGLGDLILNGMHGDRGEVVRVLRDELPAQISTALAQHVSAASQAIVERIAELVEGSRTEALQSLVEELPKRIAGELASRLRKPSTGSSQQRIDPDPKGRA